MDNSALLMNLLVAVLGGAVRVGTPFLMVSLAECITEKSGRINLGLEGVLVFSAMAGFGGAYLTGNVWLGVLAAGCSGAMLALLHGLVCSLPRVNDIAAGIALMLLGSGLAFYLGKPLIQPQAPQIPAIALGEWRSSAQVRAALQINLLFPLGVVLAAVLSWGFRSTRWGLILRMAGDSSDAARALGYSVNGIRIAATTLWRRRCARAGAAIGGHQRGLLPVRGRALYADACDLDLDMLAEPQLARRAGGTGSIEMSGLGGLNKSPNGVVVGLVQLQLPVVKTRADLAAQTARICAMVGKARRNLSGMDLVIFAR